MIRPSSSVFSFGLLMVLLFTTSCGAARVASREPTACIAKPHLPFIPPNYTSCQTSKKNPNNQKSSGITIIIDPGHGGDDLGAKSIVKPIYSEKNFNLVAARLLQSNLEQLGHRTVMTREKDVFVTLANRSKMATRRDNEIFVSVHFNAAQSPTAEGIEVFYYNSKNDAGRTSSSKALADEVLKHLITTTHAKSRGVKHGNYYVIRETSVPAILIEGGFLTHPAELDNIKNPGYLKKLAWGAAQGISHYINKTKA